MIRPRFLWILLAATAAWACACIGFIWVIDPYGVSPLGLSLPRVNQHKPKRFEIDRLIKPYEVWRYQPKTIFLGTSRIHQSIDPSILDGTAYGPAYNASIPASSLGLNVSHLRQYIELNSNLRTVVVELFLYNFTGQSQERPLKSFREYLQNSAALFVSADALLASAQTFWFNFQKNGPAFEIHPRGYFVHPGRHQAKGQFDGFAVGIWRDHETRADGMKLYEPAFETVREFIKLATRHELNLIFVLTPNHAYEDYYIDAVGEWKTVAEMLRRVTSEATLYSFSQPNAWVYEPVSETMQYWNDPYHFSLRMGYAMQAALAGIDGVPMPEGFLQRLTPETVSTHVESRREAIRRWAKNNPDFVSRFREERQKWESARVKR